MARDREERPRTGATGSPEPWQRRPDESAIAYRYFRRYRDLGPERTVVAVAQEFRKQPSHLYRLSRRFDWRERAGARDLSQEREEAANERRLGEEVARRQLAEVDRLRGLPLAGLAKWAHRNPVTGEWELDPKVKPRDMVALLELLWETESKAAAIRGQSEGAEAESEAPSIRTLSLGERQQLLALAKERAQQRQEGSADVGNGKAQRRATKRGAETGAAADDRTVAG